MKACPICQTPNPPRHRFCAACGADLSSVRAKTSGDQLIGSVIGGQFVLRKLVGTGGMGKVYAAEQKGVGRTVAVKILHSHLIGDQRATARFTNEARASSQLNHPHTISVIDFGQTETGLLYLVMEYLDGHGLGSIINEEDPIPLMRIVHIMCQTLEAVDAAHRLNIVHRDLKPENIYLLTQRHQQDFVKVLDFGIAKMLDFDDRSITTPGLVPGTPEYMSPEQAKGEPIDARSDIYALGVILYELLTGHVPFKEKSPIATMMAHVRDAPDPPSKRVLHRRLPKALDSIVLWALAKNPKDRIRSANHFAEVLSAWAQIAGVWQPTTLARASSPDILDHLFDKNVIAGLRVEISAEEIQRHQQSLDDVFASVKPVRRSTILYGRERELAHLERFLGRTDGAALRIEGELGVGKSRLGRECRAIAERKGYRVFVGYGSDRPAFDGTQDLVAHLVLFAVQALFPTLKGTSPSSSMEHSNSFQTILRQCGLSDDTLPGIEDLLGLKTPLAETEPHVRWREWENGLRYVLARLGQQRHTLILVDDVELLSSIDRKLLLGLLSSPCAGISYVVTHSPEFQEQWHEPVECIVLDELDDATSHALLKDMLSLSPEKQVASALHQCMAGNPLYLEQLAFASVSDGIVYTPTIIADLIADRVARLSQGETEIVQASAVYNGEISQEILATILERPVEDHELHALVSKGFFQRYAQGIAFAHPLIAMVVYTSTPAEVRRDLHARIAMLARSRGIGSHPVIAHHAYESDGGWQALEELDRAAHYADRRLDDDSATKHYTHALALIRREWGRGRIDSEQLDTLAMTIAERFANLLRRKGDLATAEGVLGEILSVANGPTELRISLRLELARIDVDRNNPHRALKQLEIAKTEATHTEHGQVSLVRIQCELARALGMQGDRDTASRILFETAMVSDWNLLLSIAKVYSSIGFPDRARGFLLDAWQAAEQARSLVGKFHIVKELARSHQRFSEWTEAEMRLLQGIDLAKQLGDRTHQASFLTDLGRIRRIVGDAVGGREFLDRAVEICQRIDWAEGHLRAEHEIEMLKYAKPQSL